MVLSGDGSSNDFIETYNSVSSPSHAVPCVAPPFASSAPPALPRARSLAPLVAKTIEKTYHQKSKFRSHFVKKKFEENMGLCRST